MSFVVTVQHAMLLVISYQNMYLSFFRPFNASEKKGSYSVVDGNADKKEVTVKEKLGISPSTKTFTFDHVFGSDTKQVNVYKTVVTPIIQEVLNGYNCTIFA